MSEITWRDKKSGITVEEDSQGRFWIRTSDDTPPAFRKKPYYHPGPYADNEIAVYDAEILSRHINYKG